MELVYPSSFSASMLEDITNDKGYILATALLDEAIADCRLDMDDVELFINAYGGVWPIFLKLLSYLKSHLATVFMFRSLVYPAVSLTILYTFVRSAGMLFGADLSEIARGLAKII